MAHSFDRTMLSSLGFSDPDKKSSEHDDACAYIVSGTVAAAIASRVMGKGEVSVSNGISSCGVPCQWVSTPNNDGSVKNTALEIPISKGRDAYKTTIGFIDAAIVVEQSCKEETFESKSGKLVKAAESYNSHMRTAILVEVKIHPVGIGDILRQVNLYREYREALSPRLGYPHEQIWCVITRFAPPVGGVEALRSAGIRHFKLGSSFDDYLTSAHQKDGDSCLEI